MTAQLSRQTILGIAPETTPGVYVAPTVYIPALATIAPEDIIAPLRDESFRANDSVLQGQYGGPSEGKYAFEMEAYPIEQGHLLRAMIGTDSVTAAPTSTTLSSPITAGSTAIALTVAGTPNSVVYINDGTNPPETRYLVTATTVNAPWSYPHLTGAPAVYLTKHTFAQAAFPQPQPKTYSLTDFDGVQTRGWTYGREDSLGITIDAKGTVRYKTSWITNPSAAQTQPTPTYTTLQPLLGWQFAAYPTSLAAAGINTRYKMVDFTLTRATQAEHTGDQTQGPREIFGGPVDGKGKATAIYENDADYGTFRNYTQSNGLQILVCNGADTGSALLLNFGKPSTSKFVVSRSGINSEASLDLDAVANTTNGGIVTATLYNTQASAY